MRQDAAARVCPHRRPRQGAHPARGRGDHRLLPDVLYPCIGSKRPWALGAALGGRRRRRACRAERRVDRVAREVEEEAEVGVGEVLARVLEAQADVDPPLERQPQQRHGHRDEAHVPELVVRDAHGPELLARGLEVDDVGEVAAQVPDGVRGPRQHRLGVRRAAPREPHPVRHGGVQAPELARRDLEAHQQVEVDVVVLGDVLPGESGLEAWAPPVHARRLGRGELDEHVPLEGWERG